MRASAICVALLVLAPGSLAETKPLFLVGNWYGEEQPEDPNVFWLAHFFPDGKFEAKFRTCHQKQIIDEVDEGRWTYKNAVAEVTSTLVNGRTIDDVQRYHTLSYDGRKHIYRHEATGFIFTAVRVGADFELPSCNLSS
jgi:hypothetical protein